MAGPKRSAFVACDLAAVVEPDVGTVEVLARLQLAARRHGCEVRVRHASSELRELVDFVGLRHVLPLRADLGLEPEWQPEQREQAGGVEEEGDPDDLAT